MRRQDSTRLPQSNHAEPTAELTEEYLLGAAGGAAGGCGQKSDYSEYIFDGAGIALG